MKISVIAAIVLLPWCFDAAAADAETSCNQLGREIALRAAERTQSGLNAAARSELAGIAEAVCLEFTVPAAGSAADAGEAESTNSAPEAGGKSLFDLEIIPPEERVRRPGLKRL